MVEDVVSKVNNFSLPYLCVFGYTVYGSSCGHAKSGTTYFNKLSTEMLQIKASLVVVSLVAVFWMSRNADADYLD